MDDDHRLYIKSMMTTGFVVGSLTGGGEAEDRSLPLDLQEGLKGDSSGGDAEGASGGPLGPKFGSGG